MTVPIIRRRKRNAEVKGLKKSVEWEWEIKPVLTTDENGETEQIPLETVDKSFSQNPYYAGTPYISYNVLAQMSGFNSLYVKSIPIRAKVIIA